VSVDRRCAPGVDIVSVVFLASRRTIPDARQARLTTFILAASKLSILPFTTCGSYRSSPFSAACAKTRRLRRLNSFCYDGDKPPQPNVCRRSGPRSRGHRRICPALVIPGAASPPKLMHIKGYPATMRQSIWTGSANIPTTPLPDGKTIFWRVDRPPSPLNYSEDFEHSGKRKLSITPARNTNRPRCRLPFQATGRAGASCFSPVCVVGNRFRNLRTCSRGAASPSAFAACGSTRGTLIGALVKLFAQAAALWTDLTIHTEGAGFTLTCNGRKYPHANRWKIGALKTNHLARRPVRKKLNALTPTPAPRLHAPQNSPDR